MSPTATATRSGSTALTPASRRPWYRRTLVVTIGVMVMALTLGAAWLMLFSSALRVREVDVDGTQQLSADQVQQLAQVPMGRPLARADLKAISERTVQHPRVASVQVSRDWPSTLRIAIVERRALLAVPQPDGYLLFDRSGHEYTPGDPVPDGGLTAKGKPFDGPLRAVSKPGVYLMVDETGLAYETQNSVPSGGVVAQVNPNNRALLTQVAAVAGALPDRLREEVLRVSATTQDNIELTLDSGIVVSWGDSSQSALKAELTEVLLEQDPRSSIDVSSPHNPAVK